uniref:Uncharacterized protein n=1 Tax=Streptomyces kanamyceticus TaxID=1967 RepID=E9KTE0_STRKN|nr:hypothetical protein Tcs_SK_056 [Streptomyces kanamyceticus]
MPAAPDVDALVEVQIALSRPHSWLVRHGGASQGQADGSRNCCRDNGKPAHGTLLLNR